MVGVGGRSKACANCYRRRIKCDETKPKCQKCAKAKLDCSGYKSLTIIHYDGSRNSLQKSHGSHNDADAAAGVQRRRPDIRLSTSASRKPHPPAPSLSYDLAYDVDKVFVNYALVNLVSAISAQNYMSGIYRDVSDSCFLALATFFFGNEHKEVSVIQQGLQRYGKALQKLNVALSDPSARKTYDVLESVILMTMFEYLMADKPDGWIAHCVGLERLMEARGPQSFTSVAERTVLERSRASIIFACLVLRKDTILSQPDWKVVPWESNGSQKSLLEHLVDIMTNCPRLLVLQDKMNAATNDEEASVYARKIGELAAVIRDELSDWKRKWDVREPNHRCEASPSTSPSAPASASISATSVPEQDPRKLKHTKFLYQSLYHANAITLYDATIIMLERVLLSTIHAEVTDSKEAAEYDDRMYAAAVDIARSADYCVDNALGSLASFYILYPIRMAWVAVCDRDVELKEWLEATLRKIHQGTAGHWAVAKYVLKLAMSKQPITPPQGPAPSTVS